MSDVLVAAGLICSLVHGDWGLRALPASARHFIGKFSDQY